MHSISWYIAMRVCCDTCRIQDTDGNHNIQVCNAFQVKTTAKINTGQIKKFMVNKNEFNSKYRKSVVVCNT